MNLQYEKLVEVFLEWNSKLNLSSFRTREEVMIKHITDSLLIAPFQWIHEGAHVLDLGTGGGFPGLALAIAYPKTSFTLCDATEKKLKAVENMAKSLHLTNVSFLLGRAEELGWDKWYRERFHIVIARALAPFPTLLEYALPFVEVGGKFIAYEGPEMSKNWEKYEKIAKLLSSSIIEVKEAELPNNMGKRSFIVVKKQKPITGPYPRRTGIPKKNPLA